MIFIIGGNGFVGSAFVRHCKSNKIDYQSITKDNYKNFIGQNCDVLINANGNSSKILSKNQPLEDFDKSVTSVKKSLLDFNFKKYVLISSCDVYPDCSSSYITKENTKIEVSHQSPYGFHKYLAEKCVIHSASDWLIVRLGGMVGEGLKKNPIFDILHGGPLWVNPESEMQFMNTNDVAKITFRLMNQKSSCEIFNVCGSGLVMLKDIMDRYGSVRVNPNSPKTKYQVNIEKIQKEIKIPNSMESVCKFIENYRRYKKIDY